MRKKQEILEAKATALDKYEYLALQSIATTTYPEENDPKEIKRNMEEIKDCKKFIKEMEKKYGKKNLSPRDGFEFGILVGRLETLRWVLGEDWREMDI